MAVTYNDAETDEPVDVQHVIITDFDMPFWSMVNLMIKWSFASIPAAIVIFGIVFLLSLIFAGIGSQLNYHSF